MNGDLPPTGRSGMPLARSKAPAAAADLRVRVKGRQQLDVRSPTRWRGTADTYRQAVVMGGPEHDSGGYAEQLADLVSG